MNAFGGAPLTSPGGQALLNMKMDCFDGNGSEQATARSMHPAGVHISFCDASVTFISDSIENVQYVDVHRRRTDSAASYSL